MAQPKLKNSYHYAPNPLPTGKETAAEEGNRNSGRKLNAIKHGGCSKTLILPHESIGDWELVLKHWCQVYRPKEDSLEFDFVLKVAQAEFRRLRADRNYDDFLASLESSPPFAWTETEIKTHNLMQRYLTAATREFERQYRMLEHHYKTHKPEPADEIAEEHGHPVAAMNIPIHAATTRTGSFSDNTQAFADPTSDQFQSTDPGTHGMKVPCQLSMLQMFHHWTSRLLQRK